MKEYIEKMKAVSVIKRYDFTHCPEYMQDWATKLKRAILDDLTDDMMKVPAADVVEHKRGEWVWKRRQRGGFRRYTGVDNYGETRTITVDERIEIDDPYCPFCGKLNESVFLNFCPNCGADMREG